MFTKLYKIEIGYIGCICPIQHEKDLSEELYGDQWEKYAYLINRIIYFWIPGDVDGWKCDLLTLICQNCSIDTSAPFY